MKLITPEFEEIMKDYPFYSQDGKVSEALVIAKFFNPCGSQTWYVLEYDKESKCIFGYVTGMDCDEFGYTSVEELESLKLPFPGLTIERDLYFTQAPLVELKKMNI